MKRGKGVLVLTFWLIRVTHCVEDNSEFFLQDPAREKKMMGNLETSVAMTSSKHRVYLRRSQHFDPFMTLTTTLNDVLS